MRKLAYEILRNNPVAGCGRGVVTRFSTSSDGPVTHGPNWYYQALQYHLCSTFTTLIPGSARRSSVPVTGKVRDLGNSDLSRRFR